MSYREGRPSGHIQTRNTEANTILRFVQTHSRLFSITDIPGDCFVAWDLGANCVGMNKRFGSGCTQICPREYTLLIFTVTGTWWLYCMWFSANRFHIFIARKVSPMSVCKVSGEGCPGKDSQTCLQFDSERRISKPVLDGGIYCEVCRANTAPPSYALQDRRHWRLALKKAWRRQAFPVGVAFFVSSKGEFSWS